MSNTNHKWNPMIYLIWVLRARLSIFMDKKSLIETKNVLILLKT